MKKILSGAALVVGFALVVPASAAPGQCSLTGYDEFDCDVTVDGGGVSFVLPDGQTFVFAHIADEEGLGYLIPAETEPGRAPEELGGFAPDATAPGCWLSDDGDTEFCAALAQ